MLAFGDAVAIAKNDAELVAAVRKYADVDHWTKYIAVDRAADMADNTMLITSEGKTHNFFMYQTLANKFLIVPWDVEDAFDKRGSGSPKSAEIAWDAPICKRGHREGEQGCIPCSSFGYTAWGQRFYKNPSCFNLNRAFALGFRSLYIDASRQLLSGPLLPCRTRAKINRWKEAIKFYVEEEKKAGLYPPVKGRDNDWWGQVYRWRDYGLPERISSFRSTISCSRRLSTSAWNPELNNAVPAPYPSIKSCEDPTSWVALGGGNRVPWNEGNEIGVASGNSDQCGRFCDLTEGCRSFAYCSGKCFFKDRQITESTPSRYNGGCNMYFKAEPSGGHRWQALGGGNRVPVYEGASVGSADGDINRCVKVCDDNARCKSFTFCSGKCYLKDRAVTAGTESRYNSYCSTYFMTPEDGSA
jgi:hypothetical protein